MILKINHVEQEFDYNKYNVCQLILEDPNVFYNTTNNLINQMDGGVPECFLYENDKDMDLSKYAEIIYDYYDFTCNNKKTNSLIQKKILQLCESLDFVGELDNLNKTFLKVVKKISDNVDLPIEMNKDIQFNEIVKFMDIEIKEGEALFDRLIDYINILAKLKNVKLLVFYNLTSYLSPDNIKLIFKQCIYNEIKVLLIGNVDNDLPADKKVVIDDQLCEI